MLYSLCVLFPSIRWYFEGPADDTDNSVLNGIGGLCDKVSTCYNYNIISSIPQGDLLSRIKNFKDYRTSKIFILKIVRSSSLILLSYYLLILKV